MEALSYVNAVSRTQSKFILQAVLSLNEMLKS